MSKLYSVQPGGLQCAPGRFTVYNREVYSVHLSNAKSNLLLFSDAEPGKNFILRHEAWVLPEYVLKVSMRSAHCALVVQIIVRNGRNERACTP